MIICLNLIYYFYSSRLTSNFSRGKKLLHVFWNTLYDVYLEKTSFVCPPLLQGSFSYLSLLFGSLGVAQKVFLFTISVIYTIKSQETEICGGIAWVSPLQ